MDKGETRKTVKWIVVGPLQKNKNHIENGGERTMQASKQTVEESEQKKNLLQCQCLAHHPEEGCHNQGAIQEQQQEQ
jgi:hypothetical protein